ncbi:hypothetical protein DSCA_11190 [Desulfosarcina alkanivorans]|uniref:Peptidase C58 YopT-type domain-containing protein n=1 Tax=Desulfosarcina alkanivorans TaxID=571177 RepID=A0A5K7YH73_9BACT|nr:hypothetical protein [Desulfosarcina alkanivorans]BBO67189.1 hypothetical protein DSCA_11190 [Desulfosarcina alkanivorans]
MKTIWTFDQSSHLPADNQGVCMTLVAYWLSMMHDEKAEMNASSKTLETMCKQEAQKLQRFYEKAGNEFDTGKDEAVTFAVRGLKLKGNYRSRPNAAALVDYLDEKRRAYSMGIYFSDGGGHSLGIWRSGRSSGLFHGLSGHSYFFDPNYGCYKGNISDFRGWLASFIAESYPTCNHMSIAKVQPLEKRAHWGGAFRY